MAKIFISYARKDAGEIADELADQLRAKDHEVFLDVQSIRAGARWRSELSRRIKWSDLIVVLVTEGSNASDYVYQEIREAEQHGKTIVPVKIGDAPLPVHLRGTWQAITLENDNLDAILLEIQSALLHSSGTRTFSPIIVAGTIVGMVIIGILAFMLLQNGGNNQNTGDTATAIDVTGSELLEPTVTSTDISTNTPEPPTVTNTDIPIPTITLTLTPRPTNTPHPTNTSTPTLTPIPQSAILYENSFENGSVSGWRSLQGTWRVIEDGDNHVYQGSNSSNHYTFVSLSDSQGWGNFTVELRVRFVEANYIHIYLCQDNNRHNYVLNLDERYDYVSFFDYLGVGSREYPEASIRSQIFNKNNWYNIHIEVEDQIMRASINGIWMSDFNNEICQTRQLAFGTEREAWFDDIRIWSLDTDN